MQVDLSQSYGFVGGGCKGDNAVWMARLWAHQQPWGFSNKGRQPFFRWAAPYAWQVGHPHSVGRPSADQWWEGRLLDSGVEAVPNVQAFCCQNCRPFCNFSTKRLLVLDWVRQKSQKKWPWRFFAWESGICWPCKRGSHHCKQWTWFCCHAKTNKPNSGRSWAFSSNLHGGPQHWRQCHGQKKQALSESTTSVAKRVWHSPRQWWEAKVFELGKWPEEEESEGESTQCQYFIIK